MKKSEVSTIIKQLLIDRLSLDLNVKTLTNETLLLGNIPEFDSMAIVSIITALEERFTFTANDDDLSAEAFESIESLVQFVFERMSA